MTTTTNEIRAAIDKGLQLLEDLAKAESLRQDKRAAENELIAHSPVEDLEATASSQIEAATAVAEEARREAEAAAAKPLAIAQAKYDADVHKADEQYNQAVAKATDEAHQNMVTARRQYEEDLAVAQAEEHSARMTRDALKAELERLCSVTRQQSGYDLAALLDAVKD